MSTGYRKRTHTDGSNARIGYAAGNLIPALDDLLTAGSSPWTKTTNGTNDITYTAPAGSQVKFRIVNNTAATTTFHSKCNAQVGSGTVFPTATQEAAANQGYCAAKSRNTTNTATTNDVGYIGIRTDRFFMLIATETSGGAAAGWIICAAGDLPVLHGSDPGLCVILGSCRLTTLTTTAGTTGYTVISEFGLLTGGTSLIGYCEKAPDGTTGPVPLNIIQPLPCNGLAAISASFSDILLGRVLVTSGTVTTGTLLGNDDVLRGYIPWLYTIGNNGAFVEGDTFSDENSNTFLIVEDFDNSLFFAVMTSDGEAALP